MWIAHEAAADVGPDAQNIHLAPGASFNFTITDGLASPAALETACDARRGATDQRCFRDAR